MSLKGLYLLLALAGFLVPYFFLISFLAAGGWYDLEGLKRLWISSMFRFFMADVLIAGLTLLVLFARKERGRGSRFWVLAGVTVLVGPSCALPLWLYFRESDKGELRPVGKE